MLNNSTFNIKSIGVIGLGVIGGSIARAISCDLPQYSLYGYDSQSETRSLVRKHIGNATITDDIKDTIVNSDLIIVATPLATYENIFESIAQYSNNRPILITDVGSIKEHYVRKVEKCLKLNPHLTFIPSHPIAGSEKSGFRNSKQDLLKGKKVIVSDNNTHNQSLIDIWKGIGASTIFLDNSRHDLIYGLLSHIPHLLLYIYSDVCKTGNKLFIDSEQDNFNRFYRLSKSSWQIWNSILTYNDHIEDILRDCYFSNIASYLALLEDPNSKVPDIPEQYLELYSSSNNSSVIFAHIISNIMMSGLLTAVEKGLITEQEINTLIGQGAEDVLSMSVSAETLRQMLCSLSAEERESLTASLSSFETTLSNHEDFLDRLSL